MSKRIINNSNQVQIVNREYGITLQALYGEISSLSVQDEPGKEGPSDIWADNEEFIIAMWKVFKKANEMGFFREGKKVKDVDGESFIEVEA